MGFNYVLGRPPKCNTASRNLKIKNEVCPPKNVKFLYLKSYLKQNQKEYLTNIYNVSNTLLTISNINGGKKKANNPK